MSALLNNWIYDIRPNHRRQFLLQWTRRVAMAGSGCKPLARPACPMCANFLLTGKRTWAR